MKRLNGGAEVPPAGLALTSRDRSVEVVGARAIRAPRIRGRRGYCRSAVRHGAGSRIWFGLHVPRVRAAGQLPVTILARGRWCCRNPPPRTPVTACSRLWAGASAPVHNQTRTRQSRVGNPRQAIRARPPGLPPCTAPCRTAFALAGRRARAGAARPPRHRRGRHPIPGLG